MAQDKRAVTINDIAIAAGVSKTTVSRYINGKMDLINEKTRDRIKVVVDMMEFQPNSAARSLRTNRNGLIGVLLADMESPFSSALAVGISSSLNKHGYAPLFFDSCNDLSREIDFMNTFVGQRIDGLLVNTTSDRNPNLIRLACEGFPVVLCDRYICDYNFNIVTVEQNQCFYEMVHQVKNQGYTRPILFTQPWKNNSTRQRRRAAFLNAVKNIYGYDAENDIYIVDKSNQKSVSQQLDRALQTLSVEDKPVIIGVNSVTTVQVYASIIDQKLNIPADIGLCGPEDWDWDNEMNWPRLLKPNITSIYIPTKQMGYQAAELLIKVIEGEVTEPQQIILPCDLRIRESTMLRS